MKQLLIRIGLIRAPKPYGLQFERRSERRTFNANDLTGCAHVRED